MKNVTIIISLVISLFTLSFKERNLDVHYIENKKWTLYDKKENMDTYITLDSETKEYSIWFNFNGSFEKQSVGKYKINGNKIVISTTFFNTETKETQPTQFEIQIIDIKKRYILVGFPHIKKIKYRLVD